MMLPSRLGCPLSLKTPNMGNTGQGPFAGVSGCRLAHEAEQLLALPEIPKADLHRHAEQYAQLDRLIAMRDNRLPYDWNDSVQRLAKLPPGMPRLQRLNGDLDTSELHALAVNYVHFAEFVTTMLEEAARQGAVLVELRTGVGAGMGPHHMSLFREAERRVRERYPHFYAEALAAIRVPTVGGPEAFESILRESGQGLAGVDFIPDPFDTEADWTEAYVLAERAAEAGLGITAHAGEFSTANIAAALSLPGITRIGHGVYAATTPELLKRLADSGVTVECCLTSNVVLGAVSSLVEHPIRSFIQAGIPVTLSSDDPVRLCTSIEREYEQAAALGFVADDLVSFTRHGILASFTSDKRKSELLDTLG